MAAIRSGEILGERVGRTQDARADRRYSASTPAFAREQKTVDFLCPLAAGPGPSAHPFYFAR